MRHISLVNSPVLEPTSTGPSLSSSRATTSTPREVEAASLATNMDIDAVAESNMATRTIATNTTQPTADKLIGLKGPLTTSLWGENPQQTTKGVAERLRKELQSMRVNKTAIFRLLADRSSVEIDMIRRDFRDLTKTSLNSQIKSRLGGTAFKMAKLMMLGERIDPVTRDVQMLSLAMDGPGTHESLVLDVLYGAEDEHRANVREQYEALVGRDLEADIKREHTGTEEVFALAVLNRGTIEEADRIYAATRGLWNEVEPVFQALEGKSKEELQTIRETFQEVYGKDLEEHIEARLTGKDEVKALALLRDGEVSAATQIKLETMGWNFLGWGTNVDAIQGALVGKSEEERSAIRLEYAARYGDLQKDLKGRLSTVAFEDTMSILEKGDLSDAEKLHKAMRGLGADKNAVIEILEGKSLEELAAIKQDYRSHYGEELSSRIYSEFWGQVGSQMAILVETGKLELVDKLYFATSGISYDRSAIFKALSEASEEERSSLKEAFSRKYKGNIDSMLASMWSSRDVKRAQMLMEHGDNLTLAQHIDIELTGWGSDQRKIYEAIEAAPEEERRAIQDHIPLMDRMASELGDRELERVVLLLENGCLTKPQELYFAMKGWGTDEAAIHDTLRDLSFEERANLKQSYRRTYGRDLLKDLRSELSNRDYALVEDALADEPGSIRERVDRMQRRIARERGSGTLLSSSSDSIVDLFSTTGFELDHGVREYKHLAKEACLMRNVDENGDGIPDMPVDGILGAKEAQLDNLTDQYVTAKTDVSNKITSIATMTASATALAATGGMAAPAALGIIAAATGSTKVATKLLTTGDAYTLNGFDGAHDLITGAIDGMSMYGLGKAGEYLTAAVGQGVLWAGGGSAATMGVGTVGGSAASSVAGQASFEVLKKAGTEWMGKTAFRKVLSNVILGGFKGALSSGITGAAESALKDETWDQEFLDSMRTILHDSAEAARGGAEGWAIGTAAYQLGALANESIMVHLKLRVGERLAASQQFTDQELFEAGQDILGDQASTAGAEAVRAAGYDKLATDLGAEYMKSTTQGKLLSSAVTGAVTRGVSAYPKALLKNLANHKVWENGNLNGLGSLADDATEGHARAAVIRAVNDVTSMGADELSIEGARKTALTNVVKRSLNTFA